jgi:hypothetical protein
MKHLKNTAKVRKFLLSECKENVFFLSSVRILFYSREHRKEKKKTFYIASGRNQSLGLHFADGGLQFLVPRLAEPFDERPTQETVEGKFQLRAETHCVATDIPPMIGKTRVGSEPLLANGIERAADGFLPAGTPLTEETFEGTQTAASMLLVPGHKDTVTATHDTRHEVALAVHIAHALAVDDALCLCRQPGPYVIKALLYPAYLVQGDGCSGIAFHTATPVAGREVAAEALGQNVGVHHDIAHHEHATK